MGVHVVWYKRDLRVEDHPPLWAAAEAAQAQGTGVLPLYIIEPEVIGAADYAARHWQFTRDCLLELREALAALGMTLVVRVGPALEVFQALHAECGLDGIWSHEETGNGITYARDRAVRRWVRGQGLKIHELPNGGVVRRLKTRDEWSGIWEKRMRAPLTPAPESLRPVEGITIGEIPTADDLGLPVDPIVELQPGGEVAAREVLLSFLYQRGENYHREMSSPLTAEESCSRLSPYLAYGSLSMKQVVQAARRRNEELYAMPPEEYAALDGNWKAAMRSFQSRLHWRDHFMQKLEDEPEIEYHSFVRAFDELRDDPRTNEAAAIRWQAFTDGCTGYPFVDACIRSLTATGWINFRMRALLTSFASYDLWIDWHETGWFLARLFTDYEPGIHYSQIQMQSATTGINAVRIYSPVKQSQDQDPRGIFIRRWCPELATVPDLYIHTPWLMPREAEDAAGLVIGVDYPAPIVDHEIAIKAAREQIKKVRARDDVQADIERVLEKHGSRRGSNDRSRRQRKAAKSRKPDVSAEQLELGF
jgi:deoxyribodipyrimidine photo-lyase